MPIFAALFTRQGLLTLWQLLTSRTGLICLTCGAVWVFYEGVPVLKHVGSIPFIGSHIAPYTDPWVRGRVSRAYDQGMVYQQGLQAEKDRLYERVRDQERLAQQAKLDAIEQKLWDDKVKLALQLTNVQAALERERLEHANDPQPDPAHPRCYATSRRVSNALNRTGRVGQAAQGSR